MLPGRTAPEQIHMHRAHTPKALLYANHNCPCTFLFARFRGVLLLLSSAVVVLLFLRHTSNGHTCSENGRQRKKEERSARMAAWNWPKIKPNIFPYNLNSFWHVLSFGQLHLHTHILCKQINKSHAAQIARPFIQPAADNVRRARPPAKTISVSSLHSIRGECSVSIWKCGPMHSLVERAYVTPAR